MGPELRMMWKVAVRLKDGKRGVISVEAENEDQAESDVEESFPDTDAAVAYERFFEPK